MKSLTYPIGLLIALLVHRTSTAQNRFVPNYDEAAIPAYELPAALVFNDGTTVTTRAMWEESRRREVMDFFETEVYGRSPAACEIQH